MLDLRLPSFVIIGAPKCGTTWLASWLERHPSVFLPGPEPHFFSREFHRGLEWYGEWFQDAAPGAMLGEKSADYLADPNAPARLAGTLPHARLIVQLRDPVQRAYSDYCMLYRRGEVSGQPENYLDPERASMRRFVDDSLYFKQISEYLALFPASQLHVVLFDDIKKAPERIIGDVCRFLQIDAGASRQSFSEAVKTKDTPMLPLSLRRALRPLKKVVAPHRDRPWFRAVHGQLVRPVEYPPLTDRLHARLRQYYADDVRRLEMFLGRKTGWGVSDKVPA